MALSVIIPTFNRLTLLEKVLKALAFQTLPVENYEVILVDDGSQDDVPRLVNKFCLPYKISVLRQSNKGPAAARNRGAMHANGKVLLFLDSDMIATPGLLDEHLKCHTLENPDSYRGVLAAGPRYLNEHGKLDPLDWLEYREDGSDLRLDKQPVTFQEMFTCNLSILKSDWQKLRGFREEFTTPSFEDIEFAYRAWQSGLIMELNNHALAYHEHPLNLEERIKRARSYTKSVPLLYKMHPELRGQIIHLVDKEPINWRKDPIRLITKKIIRRSLSLKPVRRFFRWILNRLVLRDPSSKLVKFFYWKVIGSYQWVGLRDGIRLYGWIK